MAQAAGVAAQQQLDFGGEDLNRCFFGCERARNKCRIHTLSTYCCSSGLWGKPTKPNDLEDISPKSRPHVRWSI